MKKILTTAFLLLFLLFSKNMLAQSSNLSIQGVLRSAEGTAVENGEYDITFKLYTQEYSGDVLWQEDMTGVQVKGGIYSVVLGAGSTPLDVPFDQPYFIGVTVEGGIELTPRARLTSSPYALSLIGNDNIFPNSGNVGVGDDAPQTKLSVKRGNGVLGLEANEAANNTSTITTTANGMQFDAGGTSKVFDFNTGRIQATADEQFAIEGTDDANIEFSKLSGTAQLGYYGGNGNIFSVKNPIGLTQIEGNNIKLKTPSGTATVEADLDVDGDLEVSGSGRIVQNGETLKLIGSDHSFIGFYPQGTSAGKKGHIGFVETINPERMEIRNKTASGSLYLGTTGGKVIVDDGLHVTGLHSYSVGSKRVRNKDSGDGVFDFGTANIAIRSEGSAWCNSFIAGSDNRIKKDLQLSNNKEDLATLKKIEVTNYRHVDNIKRGEDFTKGLIAQQVKSVFPEAVSLHTEFIPNTFSFPSKVVAKNNSQIFSLPKAHDLKKGDKIKLVTDGNETQVIIYDIIDAQTFAIQHSENTFSEKTFVFGKEVEDFHTVDYDRVFTLAVSATQELARKVEALENQLKVANQENTILKSKTAQVTHANSELKAEMKGMNKRLETIEMIMNATGQK